MSASVLCVKGVMPDQKHESQMNMDIKLMIHLGLTGSKNVLATPKYALTCPPLIVAVTV